MLEVLKFIFEFISKFLAMLFTIDIGHDMSLGLLMCIVFIFLPLVLIVVNFLKFVLVNEIDERYDLKQRKGSDK
ncbi:MAG: hypothetical protein ACI4VL_02895 [Bacilli bacterium]